MQKSRPTTARQTCMRQDLKLGVCPQSMFNGLIVPHNIQAMGAGALAALSALCLYLKRAKANDELATHAQKVRLYGHRWFF